MCQRLCQRLPLDVSSHSATQAREEHEQHLNLSNNCDTAFQEHIGTLPVNECKCSTLKALK